VVLVMIEWDGVELKLGSCYLAIDREAHASVIRPAP